MFNTSILDVAIGMIFVYLLLSLICSAGNEVIELWLKKRAGDLERGLRELLQPGTKAGQSELVQRLYNHPLINGLFEGRYEDSGVSGFWRRHLRGTNLPSYIPARSFALALMDIILPGQAAGAAGDGKSGAAGAMVSAPSGTPSIAVNVQPAQPGQPATPAVVVSPATVPPPVPNPLQALRDQVPTIGNPQVEQAVIALIDAAGNNVPKARENIENWFNSSMDRVSGWYKRRSQFIVLGLGLFVAIAVNADSVLIVKRLSSDRALRESLVAAAEAYAKANAEATPNPTTTPGPASNPAPATTVTDATNTNAGANTNADTNTNSNVNTNVNPSTNTNTNTNTNVNVNANTNANSNVNGSAASPTLTSSKKPEDCWKGTDECKVPDSPACKLKESQCKLEECWKGTDECKVPDSEACKLKESQCKLEVCWKPKDECKVPGSPACKLKESQCRLEGLGLPIGWNSKTDPYLNWEGGTVWQHVQRHWLGWLLTALAISLGAPFWFDTLNKFIVVRSTIKPREKSQEEKSKD